MILSWVTDVDLDFGSLVIDDDSLTERPTETKPSLLMSLYTIYGVLFHMGYLIKSKHQSILSMMLISHFYLNKNNCLMILIKSNHIVYK